MKRTGVARTPLRKGEKLQDEIEAQLEAFKKAPRLLRSFFKAPSVAYIPTGEQCRRCTTAILIPPSRQDCHAQICFSISGGGLEVISVSMRVFQSGKTR
jgi:hypothetical protein